MHPLRQRLMGFALVTEIMGRDWARGRLQHYPTIHFELSFEDVPLTRLPGTSVRYLGLMDRRRNLFEFQFGHITTNVTEEEYQLYVYPFIERLQFYNHSQASFDRAFDDMMKRR